MDPGSSGEGFIASQERVDRYMTAILQGLLSDGDLVLTRINPNQVLDLAEALTQAAIIRANKMSGT